MKTIPLEKEFKIWLVDDFDISEASSKSYVSYLTSVNKIINLKIDNKISDLFFVLNEHIESKENQNIEDILMTVVSELSKSNSEELFDRAKKTLQNYKSAIFSYIEFLNEYLVIENNFDSKIEIQILNEEEEIVSEIENTISFTKKELIKIFKSRIKTWDRVYDNIFFPIRFISRIFREQDDTKEYNNWIKKLINSIIIYTDNSKVSFKEISGLSIIKNKVYIDLKDTKILAYTKLADNNTREPFEILQVGKITIDHSVSLHDIMNKNIKKLPIMNLITEELKKYMKGNLKSSKLVKVSSLKSEELSDFIKKIDNTSLLNELKIISSETDLQLMKGSYNTSKGKK